MDRQHPSPRLLEFERLIPDSVGIAMRASGATDLLNWVRECLYAYATFDSPIHDNPNLARALAFAWTRAVWNGLPVNLAGVRPVALLEPGLEDLCPCGSDRKFKSCCRTLPEVPALTANALWPYVLANMRSTERIALVLENRVSCGILIEFAAYLLEQNRSEEVIAALAPRLATPERYNDEDAAILLHLLCDAYGTAEKGTASKLKLLQTTTARAPRSPLRAEAWQRLATIFMDRGDGERAWQAFDCAQEENPQAETLCVLEVELLTAEHRLDKASERAQFWLTGLEREGTPAEDPRIEFLRRMASDPGPAPLEAARQLHGSGNVLRKWLLQVRDRDFPAYTLENREGDCVLVTPAKLLATERLWREVFPLEKPVEMQDQRFGGSDIWDADAAARWCGFLESHPECFDSIEILDDIATAIGRHPRSGSREVETQLLVPVLERNAAILEHLIPASARTTLGWTQVRNRSALRGLVRLMQSHLGRRSEERARRVGERLLQLNPTDDHAVRELLRTQRRTD